MIVIKINYSSVSPVVNVNYDESPIYVRVMYGGAGDSITEWGEIIGTLSNQTDLQNALNAKVPYSGATANVDLGEYELKAGQIELDQSPTGVAGVAVTRWNDTIGSTETTLKGGSVVLKNGVDLVARIVNKVTPNTTLTKAAYQAVRISGAQGQRLAVAFAQANNDNNSADTIGLVTETIATNQEGFIMTVGSLEGINTTGTLQGETWSDGDVLYLSPTVAGAITNIKPVAPQHLVVIGYVEYAHQNNGKIYVKIMNGWELGELHDVNTNGATNGQVLTYNGSIWVPSTNGVGTVTSVDMTVPTGLTVSGNPITSSGTLALGLASGYSIPTDANQTNWNAAYNDKINSAAVTGTTTKTLTLNQQDGGTITASWTDYDTAPVTSVFGRTGAVVATSGDYTTDQVTEGTNLYFTDARARAAISLTTTGTSGAATYVGGVLNIPQYQAALTNPITGTGAAGQVAYWSGTNTQTGSNNFYIDAATSKLGIGTSSPTSNAANSGLIHINGNASNSEIHLTNSSTGTSGTDGSILLQYATQTLLFNLENNILAFGTNNTERARFTAGGNLLVGTTTDGGQRLQVTGTGYFSDSVGIGTTLLTGYNLRIGKNITGATTSYGYSLDASIQSDVTSNAFGYDALISTQTASFNFNNLRYFAARSSGYSLTGTITNVIGFNAQAGIDRAVATNVYGFQGEIASGTNRWNLYMNGTANNYMAGSLGIGQTSLTGFNLVISKTLTGAIITRGVYVNSVIQSDVTNNALYFSTDAATIAQSFTLTNLRHYQAAVSGFGVGSTITTQSGFYVAGTVVGATNNYGFHGLIPSGTGNWNIYMQGTASNYLNGDTAIGTTTLGTATKLTLGGSETASSAIARGQLINTTLTAAANNDVLVGLDINPTFTVGAFTGVSRFLARFNNSYFNNDGNLFINPGSNGIGLQVVASSGSNFSYFDVTRTQDRYILSARNTGTGGASTELRSHGSTYSETIDGLATTGASILFATPNTSSFLLIRSGGATPIIFANNGAERARYTSSGNLLVGTTTDAGYRLDVNGTARVQGNTTISKDQNSDTYLIISNTTSGTGASSLLTFISDATTGNFQLGKYSAARTAYKFLNSRDSFLYNATAGDICILNDFSNGKIKLGAGASNTVHWQIETTGQLTAFDAINIAVGTTTGTKIGTATSQKIGFWNATPIVQPTTAVASAAFVANTGTAVNDASTFDGYTMAQVVKALRNAGLLA